MRPFHEIMRLAGLDADIPEPDRANPQTLVELAWPLLWTGRTFSEVQAALELVVREENIKPAVLLAACREIRVRLEGQPQAFHYRRLIFSGRMDRGTPVGRWHPSMGPR